MKEKVLLDVLALPNTKTTNNTRGMLLQVSSNKRVKQLSKAMHVTNNLREFVAR